MFHVFLKSNGMPNSDMISNLKLLLVLMTDIRVGEPKLHVFVPKTIVQLPNPGWHDCLLNFCISKQFFE